MAAEPARIQAADLRPRRLDRATALLRAYTRAFLSQGVGFIGLVWCLQQNLPGMAGGLTALVLIDQAVFLRGRAAVPAAARLQAGLDAWCLLVSCADIVILCACLHRLTGLREAGGTLVNDPLNCLAFTVATLARLDLGLVPASAAGRMIAAVEALAGDAALLAGAVVLLRAGLRGPSGPPRP